MTTYTIAIGADMLLATVADGVNIDPAVKANYSGEYDVITGLTLANTLPDDVDPVWTSGNSGWLFNENGEDFAYAYRTQPTIRPLCTHTQPTEATMAKHYITANSPDGRDVHVLWETDRARLGDAFSIIEIGDDGPPITFFATAEQRAIDCAKSSARYLADTSPAMRSIGRALLSQALAYAEMAHNQDAYRA